MSRYVSPVFEINDINGAPQVGAKLVFYTPGTTNFKTIYSDSGFTTPRTNPVTAVSSDAGAIYPDVFLDGLYDVYQQDASGTPDTDDGAAIWDRPNVGDVSTGAFELWLNDTTYSIPEIVLGSDDEYYRSLVDANQGNNPTTSEVQWEQLEFGRIWNTNVTYAIADSVYGSDGHLYVARVSQSGNDPTTDLVNWNGAIPHDTVASAVNTVKVVDSATGDNATIQSSGEADIGINFENSEGEEILRLVATPTAVNEVTITNNSTGLRPQIASSGEANIGLNFKDSNSANMFLLNTVASAVNTLEATSSATGNPVDLSAVGTDTDIGVDISAKGDGVIRLGGTACTDGSGTATGGGYGGAVLIATASASSQANVEFETGIDATYKYYFIEMITLVPAVDDDDLWLRVKRASDSTWITTGNQYENIGSALATNQIALTATGVENTTVDGGLTGRVYIANPASTTVHKLVEATVIHNDATAGWTVIQNTGGKYISTGAIEGFRLQFSTGNISSGLFRLYGVIV